MRSSRAQPSARNVCRRDAGRATGRRDRDAQLSLQETLKTLEDNGDAGRRAQGLNEMLDVGDPAKQLAGVYEEFSSWSLRSTLTSLPSKAKYSQSVSEIAKWRQMGESGRYDSAGRTLPATHRGLRRADVLAAKAEAIARGVAGLVVDELQTCADKMGNAYETINRLQENSGSAEAVMEMTAYLQSCEIEMEKLRQGLETDLEARLTLLAKVNQELPDETFTAVYTTLGWPGRVYKVADDAQKKQEEDRNHFMEELRNDKERFGEELEEWEVEIKALSSMGDMAEVEENAAKVHALQAKIDDGKERANLYNSREELFGWPVTEYPQLADLHKSLEPCSLWTTAINRRLPHLAQGPFMELSPDRSRPTSATGGGSCTSSASPWRTQVHRKLLRTSRRRSTISSSTCR